MNKKAFVKNTVVITATSLVLRTLGILFRIVISGRVGAEGMGLYQLVFSVYVLGAAFASTGLSTAVTRLAAERLVRQDKRGLARVMKLSFLACLVVGSLSAAVLWIGAPLIGGWIGDTRAVPAIAVSGIALPFIGICSCLKGYFMARRRAMPPCIAQIIEQAVRIGGILLMLHILWDRTLEQACVIIIVGDALSETVSCLFLAIAYLIDRRRLNGNQGNTVKGLLRELLGIALPLTAERYLSTGLRTVENILVPARLTLFTGSAALSLEQFGAVKGMALPLVFFPAAFLITLSGLLIPELSDAHALGQRRQVARLVEGALQITLPAGLLIGCLFTVLGAPLGQRLYHNSFVGLLLQILGPLAPVMYLDSVATGMLKGLGEQVQSLWYSLTDSAVRILLIWLLLPRYGITGFLFVMVVSNLLTCLLSTSHLLTVSGAAIQWGRWVVGPLAIAAVVGSAWTALQRAIPLQGLSLTAVGAITISGLFLLLLPLFGCVRIADCKGLFAKRL